MIDFSRILEDSYSRFLARTTLDPVPARIGRPRIEGSKPLCFCGRESITHSRQECHRCQQRRLAVPRRCEVCGETKTNVTAGKRRPSICGACRMRRARA